MNNTTYKKWHISISRRNLLIVLILLIMPFFTMGMNGCHKEFTRPPDIPSSIMCVEYDCAQYMDLMVEFGADPITDEFACANTEIDLWRNQCILNFTNQLDFFQFKDTINKYYDTTLSNANVGRNYNVYLISVWGFGSGSSTSITGWTPLLPKWNDPSQTCLEGPGHYSIVMYGNIVNLLVNLGFDIGSAEIDKQAEWTAIHELGHQRAELHHLETAQTEHSGLCRMTGAIKINSDYTISELYKHFSFNTRNYGLLTRV